MADKVLPERAVPPVAERRKRHLKAGPVIHGIGFFVVANAFERSSFMNASLLFPRRLSLQVALDIICTLPLVLPPTVTGYCLILLFGRNGVVGQYLYALTGWSIMFTWYAAVLASFVVAFPLMVKTTQAAIESVDKNLISASYSLGHGDGEPFFNHKKGGQIHDPGLFYLMSEAIDNQ